MSRSTIRGSTRGHNLHVAENYRRQGVGAWLVGQAAEWLELAPIERVLDCASTGPIPA